jgi:hypothetical protein
MWKQINKIKIDKVLKFISSQKQRNFRQRKINNNLDLIGGLSCLFLLFLVSIMQWMGFLRIPFGQLLNATSHGSNGPFKTKNLLRMKTSVNSS